MAGNYAADMLPNMLAKQNGYPIGLYLDAKTNTLVEVRARSAVDVFLQYFSVCSNHVPGIALFLCVLCALFFRVFSILCWRRASVGRGQCLCYEPKARHSLAVARSWRTLRASWGVGHRG